MATLLGQNAEIFVIDDDLKAPKTDKEFLAHGLMQMIVGMAPRAISDFVSSNYTRFSSENGDTLLVDAIKTNGKNLELLIKPHYPQILNISPAVYEYIDGKVDGLLYNSDSDEPTDAFGVDGGITGVLNDMVVNAFFEHESLLLSQAMNYDDYGWDDFSLFTGCSGGQVCYLVAHTLVGNVDLSEIRPDGLSDKDITTIMWALRGLDNYDELKPGDIEHLVENYAEEWLINESDDA